jgi:hypothetical protein
MLTFPTAGAMNVVDAEPLDGVDFKNGVLAYITLVCCLTFSVRWPEKLTADLGHRFDYHQGRQYSARR